MSTPAEHKTVQARIPAYAQEIGWTYVSRVSRAKAEAWRDFDADGVTAEGHACPASRYFRVLLHQLMAAQVRLHHLDLSMLGITGLGGEKPDQWQSET